MFDVRQSGPDAGSVFGGNGRAATPSLPPQLPAPPAPQPAGTPNATHPASWAAQLNASLFDDDVATLAPEQRAKRECLDRLRTEYLAAKASDGMLDQLEGDALRQKCHELGTDRMSFADSMYARGLDPAQVHALLEKLRGSDKQPGVDAALPEKDPTDPKSEHLDQLKRTLAPASSLAPDEVALWREAMATRFDDLHGAYKTAGGTELPATPMEKIVDRTQANTLATGIYGKGGVGAEVAPSVGGYFGMASHSAGLGSAQRLQMAGLDSKVHAAAPYNFFDESTNGWTNEVAGTEGSVEKLSFPASASVIDNAQVPMDSAAYKNMLEEAERLSNDDAKRTPAGIREYIPRLLELKEKGVLKNVASEARAPGDHTNPYTGWGFSATRRAIDGSGAMLPVLDNQELKLKGRVDLEDRAALSSVSSTGVVSALADIMPGKKGEASSSILSTDPARRRAMWDHAHGLGKTPSWPRP